jgi:hypothetical protein
MFSFFANLNMGLAMIGSLFQRHPRCSKKAVRVNVADGLRLLDRFNESHRAMASIIVECPLVVYIARLSYDV